MSRNPSLPMSELPRIQVPSDGDYNEQEITPVSPMTLSESHLTPQNQHSGQLGIPPPSYRERSLSGSTAHSASPPPSTADTTKTKLAEASPFTDPEACRDALKPDPGHEADFKVVDNRFAFSPGQLNRLLNPKSLAAFAALGGLGGIARGLRTDVTSGLSVDEGPLHGTVTFDDAVRNNKVIESSAQPDTGSGSGSFDDRIRIFSDNRLPEKKPTSIWRLIWNAYNDKILILLTVAAIISLVLGLYESLHDGEGVDWIEGVAIVVAIVIVTLVQSLTDFQKERAFVKLSKKSDDRQVKALRSGKSQMIDVGDVLAGDVLHLEPGDLVPADGVFISGHGLKCDESSATGESDALKKVGGDQVMRLIESGETDLSKMDPFIISGAKVLEGVGTYLVTSVGVNSSYGKILMAMRVEMQPTPLQVKLDGLATAIAKLGISASTLLFLVLFIRFLVGLPTNPLNANGKASEFMDIFIVCVTLIVVAVPEGLPLAVTLALAFATTRLAKLNNLVRIIKSCETMGNATTVCSDKTGTLTTNVMTVVAGTFGEHSFDDKNNLGEDSRSSSFAARLSDEEKRVIVESIAINSTAFESQDKGSTVFIGSKTETALLSFAQGLGMGPLAEERSRADVVQILPFDSGRKCMGVVQRLPNGTHRLLVKGASEILLSMCCHRNFSSSMQVMDSVARENIESIIDSYARQSLRTIALVYREFQQWPPVGCASESDPTQADIDLLLKSMTFMGIVGIQDPVRPGVPEAVKKCQHAGVTVRMVTGDNVVTARAIAKDCNIFTDGIVMEGPEFRTLSDDRMREVLPKLQVLARSSPEDKRILVTKLRELCDDIVAVTGDGTNDGPALKSADIGFSMGLSGTDVAREASAIILMDDNFASIVTALMWGRAVNDAVRKFIQFQLTVNIGAVLLVFVSSVANESMRPVLTAVQLLWINLIMDSMAALALASDPPSEEILDRKPAKRTAPLISTIMWKMIIGQTIFQLGATLILYYAGPGMLNEQKDGIEIRSVVFNAFVWMQIFNMFNNRRLDNKFNILAGIHRNYFYIAISAIMIGAQVMIMYVGKSAFQIQPINGRDWGISIVIGLLSIPWGVACRLFPDRWFEVLAKFFGKPVVLVYRPMSRAMHAFARKIKSLRRKNRGEEKIEEAVDEQGKMDMAQTQRGTV